MLARAPVACRWREGALDATRELVDRLRELGDRLECAVLPPPSDVGDRLTVDREANARADHKRDGVDDHLSPRPGVALIVDAERVRALVDQRPHTRVPRGPLIDDDPPARGI